jgi:DNA-binding response OmpR family regulator
MNNQPFAGRILVVDDSEVLLDRISDGLSSAGFDVIATLKTVGAGRHLKSCDPVILDYHMPGLDGADVLVSLRAAAHSGGASCMFLLYTSDEAMAKRHASLGFDGVLAKKGDTPALVTQAQALMRIVRLRALKRGK